MAELIIEHAHCLTRASSHIDEAHMIEVYVRLSANKLPKATKLSRRFHRLFS